jgi:malate synthase
MVDDDDDTLSFSSKQQRRRCNEEELTRALLALPCGDVTQTSVVFNLYVLLGFVQAWIQQHQGTFILQGCIEDSATAEIARSQLWQWIHFQVPIKGEDGICDVRCRPMVVARLLKDTAAEFVGLDPSLPFLCWQILTTPQFVPFLTTYLLDHLPQNELCLNSNL